MGEIGEGDKGKKENKENISCANLKEFIIYLESQDYHNKQNLLILLNLTSIY